MMNDELQPETNEASHMNRTMHVADVTSDEEIDFKTDKDEIVDSLRMRRTSPTSLPPTSTFFAFDGKPKTRSTSPYLSDSHVRKVHLSSASLKNSSSSASQRPSPLPSQQKQLPGTIVSPSLLSDRPPKQSPRSDASRSPQNTVLDQPIQLTRAASTQSYLLKYSKPRRQSPWQRFVSQGSSSLQRRLSSSNSVASENNDPLPQTISVSVKNERKIDHLRVQQNHKHHQQQQHFESKSTSDLQKSGDNESIGSIPSESKFMNDIHYEDNSVLKTKSTRNSDDMILDLLPTQSVDNSIFRCDTPIIRNRIEAKEEDGRVPTQRIIEEKESEDSAMIKDVQGKIDDEDDKHGQIQQTLSLDKSILPQNAEISVVNTQTSFFSMFSYFHSVDKMSVLYLAVFAVIGSTIRVFLARIFGHDCEFPPEQRDYLSPLSTCVTASGETTQSGGALFIDLPANMIGSFVLGIMTPLNKDVPALPWLKNNHPLQNNGSMHASIRTGFCGSLTTFSSWNTQMITMMLGKNTVLGVQIVPALMGYLLGLIVPLSSFLSGRQCADALNSCRNRRGKNQEDLNLTGDIESNDQNSVSYSISTSGVDTMSSRPIVIFRLFSFDRDDEDTTCYGLTRLLDCIICSKYSPIVFTITIFTLLVIGDFAMGSSFHKTMWVTSLMAPFGTILRWKLSFLNGRLFQNSERWKYIPLGTLFCNISACIVSGICAALVAGLANDAKMARLLLNGVKIGFAGNLSTVSTFVKEIVHLSEKKQTIATSLAYLYASGTIVLCCCFSLCFYWPIVFYFGTNIS